MSAPVNPPTKEAKTDILSARPAIPCRRSGRIDKDSGNGPAIN
jgi:hypothetical protein